MSSITRDGVTWELRAPGRAHYSARWADGHLLLHADRNCSQLTADPMVVSPRIVDTLWEKDVAAGTTGSENDVMWCESCSTTRVD